MTNSDMQRILHPSLVVRVQSRLKLLLQGALLKSASIDAGTHYGNGAVAGITLGFMQDTGWCDSAVADAWQMSPHCVASKLPPAW